MAIKESPNLDYCAALSVLLTYESLQDKLDDEKGLSHLSAKICKIPCKHYLNKAMDQFDLPTLAVRSRLKELSQLEKQKCTSPDLPAEVFGRLLAEVSSYGIEDDLIRFAIESIMFRIGKWIYLIDAADDFEKDKKKGSYNPFLPDGPNKRILINSLEWELSHCDNIFDKLPCDHQPIRNIIENILYHGTQLVAQSVLFPDARKKGLSKKQ